MIEFIKQLQQPSLYFPAGALQKAILSSKAKNPNPIYWAPFASLGLLINCLSISTNTYRHRFYKGPIALIFESLLLLELFYL